MKLADLIAGLKADRDAKLAERNAHAQTLEDLRSQDEVDEVSVSEIRAKKNGLDAEIDVLSERIVELEAEQARDEAMVRLSAESAPVVTARAAYDQVARVGGEARTYNPETDRSGAMFLGDVLRNAMFGDIDSRERLARHRQEELVERGAAIVQRGAVGTHRIVA